MGTRTSVGVLGYNLGSIGACTSKHAFGICHTNMIQSHFVIGFETSILEVLTN